MSTEDEHFMRSQGSGARVCRSGQVIFVSLAAVRRRKAKALIPLSRCFLWLWRRGGWGVLCTIENVAIAM